MAQIFETKHKLPFSLFSSSVRTGYNAAISASFAPGVDITNLHNDNYGSYEDSPAQGPFTEAHVGGNQHRHVALNTGSQLPDTRPEAFIINFDNAGELRVYGPDFVDTSRPRASLLRGNAAKRPLNIENIRSVTGSLVLGNYTRDYEIVQTSGRRINNRFLTKAGDNPVTASNSVYVTGLVDFELPDRDTTGSNKFIFVERFNAPGGPDVSSRGVLDVEAEEFAANNALPFRNLNVRLPLRLFLTQHADQFGFVNGSELSASFHKVNRNTLCRPDPDNSSSFEFVYDNWFVQHPIPRTDLQYSWITASAITTACELAGYQRSGNYSNRAGAYTDVEFVISGSKLVEGVEVGVDFNGITGSDKNSTVDVEQHTWNTTGSLQTWVNNGVYEYPIWKQIKTGEHPVARILRKRNIISIQDNPRSISLERENGTKLTIKEKSSPFFQNFIDPPVSSRFKPIDHQLMFKGSVNPLLAHEITHTYANNLGFFANKNIDLRLGIHKNEEQVYDKILEYYSDPDLPEDENPVARFLGLIYREVVYPREENSYLAVSRGRTEYAEEDGSGSNGQDRTFGQQRTFWKDDVNEARNECAPNSQNYRPIPEIIFPEGTIWSDSDSNRVWVTSVPDRSNNGNNARIAITQKDFSFSNYGISVFKLDQCQWRRESEFFIGNSGGFLVPTPGIPSFSGSYIAVSKDQNIGGNPSIAVFRSGSSGWTLEQEISGNTAGPIGEDYEDARIPSIYNNKLVIGYPKLDVPFTNCGGVEVWGSSSSGWQIELEISGTSANDVFGNSVNLFENVLVFSAPGFDPHGAIFVYESSSAGGWELFQRIDTASGSLSGMDFDGETIIAWDDKADLSFIGSSEGRLRVYKKNASDSWEEVFSLRGGNIKERLGVPNEGRGAAVWGDLILVNKFIDATNFIYGVDAYKMISSDEWILTSTIRNEKSGGVANIFNLSGLNNKVVGLGDSSVELDYANGNGNIYPLLRNSWGLNSTDLDNIEYNSLSFSPLRTNGILSFPESSSYNFLNGELSVDTDSTVYFGQTLPSLCFVEATNNFLTGTNTDYIERLTEQISGINPWFDSYEDYAEDIRRVGKDCSIIPEFNISEHMNFYIGENNGNFQINNRKIFSLNGSSITSSAATEEQVDYDIDFRRKYLTSDRLRYIDDVKKEHDDIAEISRVTLRCKGVKKLLPYQGFYPQNRTVQIGTLLSQSIGSFVKGFSGSDGNNLYEPHGLQALLKPLVSPGILYNSIKGGIGVDYPVFIDSVPAVRETGSTISEFVLSESPDYRLPFETLVNLTEFLPKNSPIRFVSTFNTDEEVDLEFPYYFKWDGNKSALYELAMHNFLAEIPNFFLADGQLNNFASEPEFKFKEFKSGRTYYMDVALQQNIVNNKFPAYVGTGSLKTDESKTIEPAEFTSSVSGNQFSRGGVSLYGNRMTVGSPFSPHYDGTLDTESGSVYVFNNRGTLPWKFETVLTGDTTFAGLSFGEVHDLYQDTIAVTVNSIGSPAPSGTVCVFESSSFDGWLQTLQITGSSTGSQFGRDLELSGAYLAVGAPGSDYVAVYRSGSSGWNLEQELTSSETGFGSSVLLGNNDDGNKILAIGSPEILPGSVGRLHFYQSSSIGWVSVDFFNGQYTGQNLGTRGSVAMSGNYVAFGYLSSSIPQTEVYLSGSSGWSPEQIITDATGSNQVKVTFSAESGYLVIYGDNSIDTKGAISIYRSGSLLGWFKEEEFSDITGSFNVNLNQFNLGEFGLAAYRDTIAITAHEDNNAAGAVYSFVSQSSTCPQDDGWFPLFGNEEGEFNLRQNGRLFGMAMPITGGVVQFTKSPNVYDPAYMAYTPPSFYGESIARISFTPTTSGKFTLEEIFEDAVVENILNQEGNRVAVFSNPLIAETGSLAYQNKMTVSASVTLFGKFSEPNVEFDLINPNRTDLLPRFQPSLGTKTENTNKDRWSIGTKFECPVLDVSLYDEQYSSSYTSHVPSVEGVFCDIEDLEFQTPRTPWTNYADITSDDKGVFFDVKESFSPNEYDDLTGSLLVNCGFTAGRKKVGHLADQKQISEAIVAIPYIDRAVSGVTVQNSSDCNKHFIAINEETFRRQKENFEKDGIAVRREETTEGTTQKSSTTITDMIQKMIKFVMPPQMDFVRFRDISPFVMYIFDFTSTLDQRDLINIWHGVMPKPAFRMERDEIIIDHEMNEDEFFHGNEIPDNLRWMVFKVKQRANQNYFEVTTDSSDDDRFKFDFQGDGKVEVVPELNFNWPYDFFSLVELSKIEVEIQLTNKSELDKLEQAGGTEQIESRRGGRGRNTVLVGKRGSKGKGKKANR